MDNFSVFRSLLGGKNKLNVIFTSLLEIILLLGKLRKYYFKINYSAYLKFNNKSKSDKSGNLFLNNQSDWNLHLSEHGRSRRQTGSKTGPGFASRATLRPWLRLLFNDILLFEHCDYAKTGKTSVCLHVSPLMFQYNFLQFKLVRVLHPHLKN